MPTKKATKYDSHFEKGVKERILRIQAAFSFSGVKIKSTHHKVVRKTNYPKVMVLSGKREVEVLEFYIEDLGVIQYHTRQGVYTNDPYMSVYMYVKEADREKGVQDILAYFENKVVEYQKGVDRLRHGIVQEVKDVAAETFFEK